MNKIHKSNRDRRADKLFNEMKYFIDGSVGEDTYRMAKAIANELPVRYLSRIINKLKRIRT